jgi:magnesium chelatase subunit I
MSEDDGQEDKLIERIAAEAVKNIFTLHLDAREFRQTVDYFESGKAVEIGDTLSAGDVLSRIDRIPNLRKRAEEFARQVQAGIQDSDERDAATAAAAEFILEGLHVHNKLNKTVKAGTTSYRR